MLQMRLCLCCSYVRPDHLKKQNTLHLKKTQIKANSKNINKNWDFIRRLSWLLLLSLAGNDLSVTSFSCISFLFFLPLFFSSIYLPFPSIVLLIFNVRVWFWLFLIFFWWFVYFFHFFLLNFSSLLFLSLLYTPLIFRFGFDQYFVINGSPCIPNWHINP